MVKHLSRCCVQPLCHQTDKANEKCEYKFIYIFGFRLRVGGDLRNVDAGHPYDKPVHLQSTRGWIEKQKKNEDRKKTMLIANSNEIRNIVSFCHTLFGRCYDAEMGESQICGFLLLIYLLEEGKRKNEVNINEMRAVETKLLPKY